MRADDIMAKLALHGAVLHSARSEVVDGTKVRTVHMTVGPITVIGKAQEWDDAILECLAWFDEDDALPPWPFLDVIDIGEAGA